MNRTSQPYVEAFPRGTRVRVLELEALEQFRAEWKWHHPIQPEQMHYAGAEAIVESVGFYHGGDVLYQLQGVPGTWHESCLSAAT